MTTDTNDALARAVAIATGPPLSDEPGLGPLTLPGFLREVTERYGDREALVAGGPPPPRPGRERGRGGRACGGLAV
ncbi:hypothetical protein [Nocardia abscessus]|uniref:hypothetical protein n=1 Tax=Nocardia abscessus TaxID=120957 RepID=UPI002457C83B|nr:hypothetical protein [Nocardia abscessus]